MDNWILHGGPEHLKTGSGADLIPDGYAYEGPGANYSPVYPDGTRASGKVYRWADDIAYIKDGQIIIENMAAGNYAAPADIAPLLSAGLGAASEFIRFGISEISISPNSELAKSARESIDQYRKNGLI